MAFTTEFPEKARAVTADDNVRFKTASTIYVGGGGNVRVIPWGMQDDQAVTFVGIPTGGYVPCQVRAVLSSGTTATSMVRVY